MQVRTADGDLVIIVSSAPKCLGCQTQLECGDARHLCLDCPITGKGASLVEPVICAACKTAGRGSFGSAHRASHSLVVEEENGEMLRKQVRGAEPTYTLHNALRLFAGRPCLLARAPADSDLPPPPSSSAETASASADAAAFGEYATAMTYRQGERALAVRSWSCCMAHCVEWVWHVVHERSLRLACGMQAFLLNNRPEPDVESKRPAAAAGAGAAAAGAPSAASLLSLLGDAAGFSADSSRVPAGSALAQAMSQLAQFRPSLGPGAGGAGAGSARAASLQQPRTVALCCEPRPEWLLADFACVFNDWVSVATDAAWSEAALGAAVDKAQATILVSEHAAFAAALDLPGLASQVGSKATLPKLRAVARVRPQI
jgi:hypothetical protein